MTIAGAIALVSMSASDWVAKMTLAFFLRSVLSHSRSWAHQDLALALQDGSRKASNVRFKEGR